MYKLILFPPLFPVLCLPDIPYKENRPERGVAKRYKHPLTPGFQIVAATQTSFAL